MLSSRCSRRGIEDKKKGFNIHGIPFNDHASNF